jgi:putative endonuclease
MEEKKNDKNTRSKGSKSEQIAADYLIKNGYTILERNYRCSRKEIDIIAKKGNVISFVEVKGKSESADFSPEYSITAAKQRIIFQVANYYVQKNDLNDIDFNFDVIIVNFTAEGVKVEHLMNSLQYY